MTTVDKNKPTVIPWTAKLLLHDEESTTDKTYAALILSPTMVLMCKTRFFYIQDANCLFFPVHLQNAMHKGIVDTPKRFDPDPRLCLGSPYAKKRGRTYADTPF